MKTLQRIPVMTSEPNTSPTPWRRRPPATFHVQADESLVCQHRDVSTCEACARENREIACVYGVHYWMASEADFSELVAGQHDDERGAPDHDAAVRATARADADSLDFERPGFDRAVDVHLDRSDDEPASPLELAIGALGRDVAGKIYEGEWDKIVAEGDDECDHAEWGPACPLCGAEAMAIEPGKPDRKYLVVRYDVTDLTDAQIDTLATEAIVQGEASDHDETPCGECEACLAPHVGEEADCRQHLVNHPDVEAERVRIIAC